MYKPLQLNRYLKWIHQFGWSLRKGKVDWILLDDNDHFVCTIKIRHPGPQEVSAHSVRKTEHKLKEQGLL